MTIIIYDLMNRLPMFIENILQYLTCVLAASLCTEAYEDIPFDVQTGSVHFETVSHYNNIIETKSTLY